MQMQHFICVSHIVGRVMGWWRWLCDVFCVLFLCGHIFCHFCDFICPLLIEAWIVWAYILSLLWFYMPTTHWSL